MSYRKEIQSLQEKLLDLKDIKPKVLEIIDKYWLDETTIKLQETIIKEKREEKDNKEMINEDKKEINKSLHEIKEKEEIKENEDDKIINNTKSN